MVSSIKIIFMILSAFISIGIPIIFSIVIVKKYKASVESLIVGGAVFFVFQVLLRIPLLSNLNGMDWYISLSKNYFLTALFLGITAGLFEEIGRFLGFKFIIKRKNYLYKNAIAFGIGHGGIEAILLVGLTYVNNLVMSLFINKGTFDQIFGGKINSTDLSIIKSQLIDTKAYLFLFGGVERLFAITIQIAFSLIVLYAIKNRKYLYLLIAIGLHALVDTPVAYMSMKGVNAIFIEGYVFITFILALVYILKSKEYFKEETLEIV